MSHFHLFVLSFFSILSASTAEAQCVRRTPTVVGIVQQAASKVVPMVERQSTNGSIWYEPGLGWNLTTVPHMVRIKNNDDAACTPSKLAVAVDALDGDGPSGVFQQGVYVAPGATAVISVPEVLVKSMQPGSSAPRLVHACRVSGVAVGGNGVFTTDCSAASATQMNALMGPPLISINGDATMPDYYSSLSQPLIASASQRNLAINVSAITSETIIDITGTICPINIFSSGGFTCTSNKSVRQILKCGPGSQNCAGAIKPNRMGPGYYGIWITATNQADSNGIKHGNRLIRVLQIVP